MSAAEKLNSDFIVATGAGRILVADDDRYYRNALEEKLTGAGHDVVTTPDGASAWSLVQDEPFDMVIADWMMPVMRSICSRIIWSRQRSRSLSTALSSASACPRMTPIGVPTS